MTIYEDILGMAQQLSAADKARLVADIGAALRHDLATASTAKPTQPLLGLWEGIGISEGDIDEARQDMWSTFPREDI